MIIAALLTLAVAQAPVDTGVRRADVTTTSVDTPAVRRRRAIEYSDRYYTRLTIHRYGSYAMLPLFAAEYSLGQNLINDASPPTWLKPTHTAVALGIGALFTINTVTGAMNLWEARDDPSNRALRYTHTALMLASDLGFAITGAQTPRHSFDPTVVQQSQNRHRNWAIGSIAVSTAGTALMWFWKH